MSRATEPIFPNSIIRTYDADGQKSTWTQQADANTPSVLVTEYDPVDQLLGVTGAILKQFVYGYDKAGNRTSETIQNGAGAAPALSAATYNNLNQVTNTTGGGPMRSKGIIYHEITLGVLLEGIALHAFDGNAPFSENNRERIRDLKKIYHLDFDSRASYRLRETPPPRKSKAKP